MEIKALSKDAISVLGRSEVLADPCSVVKELVENALDAKASLISIDVASNCLDLIRVRDNGTGIDPESRELVCSHYCTSKVRIVEDLRNVGRIFLGFRGESLAAIAAISGRLIITTKVQDEDVAMKLEFDNDGKLISQEMVPHPVGTAVQVENLFDDLQIRRTHDNKLSASFLKAIKRMLKAYALSRPSVRIAFKVLKSKSSKSDWIYLAKPRADMFDAAALLFGRSIVHQYTHISGCFSCEKGNVTQSQVYEMQFSQDKIYSVDAVIPKPDSNLALFSDIGGFVSIDWRPVSCACGTLKELASLIRRYIHENGYSRKQPDPFYCININCPAGSYDITIEPAKDDILFVEPEAVKQILEHVLMEAYPDVTFTSKIAIPKSIDTSYLLTGSRARNLRKQYEPTVSSRQSSFQDDRHDVKWKYGKAPSYTSYNSPQLPTSSHIWTSSYEYGDSILKYTPKRQNFSSVSVPYSYTNVKTSNDNSLLNSRAFENRKSEMLPIKRVKVETEKRCKIAGVEDMQTAWKQYSFEKGTNESTRQRWTQRKLAITSTGAVILQDNNGSSFMSSAPQSKLSWVENLNIGAGGKAKERYNGTGSSQTDTEWFERSVQSVPPLPWDSGDVETTARHKFGCSTSKPKSSFVYTKRARPVVMRDSLISSYFPYVPWPPRSSRHRRSIQSLRRNRRTEKLNKCSYFSSETTANAYCDGSYRTKRKYAEMELEGGYARSQPSSHSEHTALLPTSNSKYFTRQALESNLSEECEWQWEIEDEEWQRWNAEV